MNEHVIPARSKQLRSSFEALDFEAPYLVEKVVKDRIAADSAEADALFTEVKKYLVLVEADKSHIWPMYSVRVDEVWHQFILYTAQYWEFCQRFFGHYLQHAPSNAPQSERSKTAFPKTVQESDFDGFCARYQELFGMPLPDIWYDAHSVTLDRRVRNDQAGKQNLRKEGDMVDLISASGDVIFSVSDIAAEAIAFIARTSVFYVRELPGELEDDEKIALASSLVDCRILKVAG